MKCTAVKKIDYKDINAIYNRHLVDDYRTIVAGSIIKDTLALRASYFMCLDADDLDRILVKYYDVIDFCRPLPEEDYEKLIQMCDVDLKKLTYVWIYCVFQMCVLSFQRDDIFEDLCKSPSIKNKLIHSKTFKKEVIESLIEFAWYDGFVFRESMQTTVRDVMVSYFVQYVSNVDNYEKKSIEELIEEVHTEEEVKILRHKLEWARLCLVNIKDKVFFKSQVEELSKSTRTLEAEGQRKDRMINSKEFKLAAKDKEITFLKEEISKFDLERFKVTTLASNDEKLIENDKEINKLRNNKSRLEVELEKANKRVEELSQSNEDLEKYREMVEDISKEDNEEFDSTEFNENEEDYSIFNGRRIIFFSNDTGWLKYMSEYLTSKGIKNKPVEASPTIDKSQVASTDIVVFHARSMSHAFYFKCKDEAKKVKSWIYTTTSKDVRIILRDIKHRYQVFLIKKEKECELLWG